MKIAGIDLPEPIANAFAACRPHFVGAATFSFFVNLLFLAPALYMLQVYDRVVSTGGVATLFYVTLALAVALLVLAALDAVRGRLLIRAGTRLDALLSPIIMRRMVANGSREDVQSVRDFDTVRQALSSPATAALFDAPFAPIFILVCFLLHVWIGVMALASVALLLGIAWRNQRLSRPAIEEGSRALASAQASDQAVAGQAQTVRALGMAGAMTRRQLARRTEGLGKLSGAQFDNARYGAVSRFVRLFIQSAALGLGALLAIAGEISSGGIIAGSILIGRALQPVDALIGGWPALSGARAALARLSAALGQQRSDERERTALPDPKGHVEVDQVAVRAEGGKIILGGVSLSTSPGEVLGIVGPSGSGKTTLAKVIAGAINPDAGVVRIDGAQRSDWDMDVIGRHVGYLPQETSLLEGSVRDNIARFDPDEDRERVDERVVAAAQLAGVHELILSLPDGYDSKLGPNGAGVSSGQGQRIALARALYGDPALLVLDEPNAFLDAQGEAALLRAIRALRERKRSIILVAHRRSVLDVADRLLVLENGRAKMAGPTKDVVVRLSGASGESAA